MNERPPTLGVGMVGYAFMGAAHSLAWRTAPRFFDLPLRPEMTASCGRNAARSRPRPPGSAGSRLETDWKQLLAARRRRPGRHLHAGRQPRRDRDRRAGGGQARPLREAAGQHRRRGRGDDRGGRRRPRDGVRSMVGFTYRRVPGDRAGPPARRRGSPRRDPARPRAVPPGLDHRPRLPAVLAAAEGARRLRSARRHRRAHHRPDAVHHRPADHRAVSAMLETFVKERPLPGARAAALSGDGGYGARSGDRSRSTTPRSWLARFDGGALGVVRGHPVRDRPQERDPDRDQRQRGQPGLRLRVHERAVVFDADRRCRRPPASVGSSSPSRRTRTSRRGGRLATCSATSTRSPIRPSTS